MYFTICSQVKFMSIKVMCTADDNLLLRLGGNIASVLDEYTSMQVGRVLTIIDATIQDSVQRKAIKDLITQKMWEEEYITNQIAEILWQFDEKSGLHSINDSEKYRKLFSLPTRLVDKDEEKLTGKGWFN